MEGAVRDAAAAGLQFPWCPVATWSGVRLTRVLLLFHALLYPQPVVIDDRTTPLWPQEPSSARIHLITIAGQKKCLRRFFNN